MPDVNVLVVFYSRFGKTEQLGLAAGLGAIQAKANIRLRRVADLAAPATIDASPLWRAHLDRMNRDYVAPRPADPAWADVIVFAAPADSAAEIEGYCASLGSTTTAMRGKIAAPVATGTDETALRRIYVRAACAGMTVVPPDEPSDDPVAAAREFGRRVTEMARRLKAG
jgi:NAD(P)H dehydrogenase (quinone)